MAEFDPGSLVEHADDVILVFDREHRYVYANRAREALTGIRNADILGKPIEDVVTGADSAQWGPALEEVITTGRSQVVERTLQTPHGPRRHSAQLTCLPGGHVCVISRDITESESTRLLSIAATAMVTGLAIVEAPSGRLLFVNDETRRLFGAPSRPVAGKDDYGAYDAFDLAGRPLPLSAWPITRALAGETVTSDVIELLRGDGSRVIVEMRATPVRDASGAIIAAVCTYHDVTAAHRGRVAAQFLAAAGAVLEQFDPSKSLQAIVDLAVPGLADWCFIHLKSDGHPALVAMANADPEKLAAARARVATPRALSADSAVMRVLGGGPRELVQVDSDVLARASRDPDHLARLRAQGYRSAVVAPLAGRGGVLGAVTFTMADSGRTYTEADLDMLAELARRTGIALENARLFEAEQRARKQAEDARDRTRRLQALTTELSATVDKAEVTRVMVAAGRAALGADGAYAWMLRGTETVELAAFEHGDHDAGHLAQYREFPLSAKLPVCDVVRTGLPVVVESVARMKEAYPLAKPPPDNAPRSWAVMPFIAGGCAFGAITFTFHEERAFKDEDRELLAAMIGQASLALERATLLEAERTARAALQVREEQLRLALIAGRAATWSVDIATMRSTRDPSFRELIGIPDETITADFTPIHPDDRHIAQASFERTLRDGTPYTPEVRMLHGNGTYMWIRAHGRLVLDEHGKPKTITGVMVDIDESKRASLRAEEERHVKETLHRLAHTFASELDHGKLVTLITDEVTRLVGAARGVFVSGGEPPANDPADRSVLTVPIVARGGERFGTLVFSHAEAGRFTDEHARLANGIAAQAAVSLENAQLYGALREHKDQLEEAIERARLADRRKDEFLAMLGHELRNPLAPIRTAIELMEMKGTDTVQKERAVIRRQVEHMTRLVDDLLDVSRITRGKIELAREPLELSLVIGKAIEVASPLLEKRMQHLVVDVPRRGLPVDADPTRLAQVFQNLLTNAAKYSERSTRIELRARAEDGRAVIEISDQGIGIPPEILGRLFELFVQGERALDRSQGGLGIGLTVAKSLVDLHDGTIEARSEGHGKGSTFTVRLPLAAKVARGEATPARGPRLIVSSGVRVLVVDDNVDAAQTLTEFLATLGHETVTAHDGIAALHLAATFQPDVAVLDIGLPVMDGYELARKLREQRGGGKLRLIALTGYGQETDRVRARAAGFDHHLVKPVELDALMPLLSPES